MTAFPPACECINHRKDAGYMLTAALPRAGIRVPLERRVEPAKDQGAVAAIKLGRASGAPTLVHDSTWSETKCVQV